MGVAWMCDRLLEPSIHSLQSYSYACLDPHLEHELHELVCV